MGASPKRPDTYSIISLVRMCEKLHALPHPGGVLEQDPFLMGAIAAVAEADYQKEELERKKEEFKSGTNRPRRRPHFTRKRRGK